MKRALVLMLVTWFLSPSTNAQNVLTRKEIYRTNCRAIVQISVNDHFSGNGFLASADGLIITANHVITTKESKFREYTTGIRVAVAGKPGLYPARPVNAQVSDDQANYDSAIIKITASDLPHVPLGNWSDIDIGDSLTIITSWPDMGCLVLDGSVSGKGPFSYPEFGPNPVNTVLFQSPVRNGFSGSPIFNSKGDVVGIVDTKLFGISPALDEIRASLTPARGKAQMIFDGTNIGGSLAELINNLDQNLISGLGSGVDIFYAKKQQENWQSGK